MVSWVDARKHSLRRAFDEVVVAYEPAPPAGTAGKQRGLWQAAAVPVDITGTGLDITGTGTGTGKGIENSARMCR